METLICEKNDKGSNNEFPHVPQMMEDHLAGSNYISL